MDKVTRELPSDFVEMVSRTVADFGLIKIKVFAPDGETVYSTSEKDIGVINERDYFHNIVAKGGVFTKVVYRDTKSLEDQVVSEDVVETYVPIMHASSFVGAYEVYFDITANKNGLDDLLFKSNALLLLIAAGLLLSILFISFIAKHSFIKQEAAEKEINQQSLALQVKNSELLMINEELDLILNFVPGIICTAGTDGYFKSVNPAMEKTLGFSKEELLSRPLFDFIHPKEKKPVKTKSKVRIGGRRISYFQNRYLCKNGSYRLLEWHATSAVDEILYATARDITEQKLAEEEREKLIVELQKALDEIKTLHGIIPICLYCKKIRNDQGAWDKIEFYLIENTDAQFSHGACPDCSNKKRQEEIEKRKK
jgi:PAS domain S-box-containing protein